ncbi:MAG TPA: hypothetical protein VIF37_01465 [Methylobacter sp.]|jgi:uncharacterized membrane protein YgcG
MIIRFFFIISLFLANVSYADTYDALSSYSNGQITAASPGGLCIEYFDANYGSHSSYVLVGFYLAEAACMLQSVDPPSVIFVGGPISHIQTCPGGGTLENGGQCIGAPSCTTNKTRVDGVCKTRVCSASEPDYDPSTGKCTGMNIPDCSTAICGDSDYQCIKGDKSLGVVPACPLGNGNTNFPDCSTAVCGNVDYQCVNVDSSLNVVPACSSSNGSGGTSGGGTSGGGTSGGGTSGGGTSGGGTSGGGTSGGSTNVYIDTSSLAHDSTVLGVQNSVDSVKSAIDDTKSTLNTTLQSIYSKMSSGCPAYFHSDGFGGCSNGDCPAGFYRDTINGIPCQPIPTNNNSGGNSGDLAKDTSIQSVVSSVDNVKTSIDALKASNESVLTSSIDSVRNSVDDSRNALTNSIEAITSGQQNSVSFNPPGFFDDALADAAVASAQSDYETAYYQIKSSFLGQFQLHNVGGGGQLPVFDFGTIMGADVVVDFNRYADPFSWVGLAIMFVAAFISLMIFLG